MAAAAMKHMASNFAKLDKFEGVDFRRWQKKMHFLLSSMSVVYVLTTPIPEDGENATMEQIRRRNKILEAKYMADDASSRKFLVSNFINYKMTNSRPVIEQYNELLDFKHTLKHKKEELTLVELVGHLRIEESLRVQDSDKPKNNNVVSPLAINMVEHNNFIWLNIVNDNIGSAFMSTPKLNDLIIWHARLGHVHYKRMHDMSKDGLIPSFYMDTEKWNKKYFVTFIDDASRSCYVYLLHTKNKALDKFKVFKIKVELQQGSQFKRFKFYRGGEYMDTLYFQFVGIIHETTTPYTPQQNGIYERKNRVQKVEDIGNHNIMEDRWVSRILERESGEKAF
ncbi:zinc finger, CCHC-type containing protein [Tanacetum coccineum]